MCCDVRNHILNLGQDMHHKCEVYRGDIARPQKKTPLFDILNERYLSGY